MRVAIEVTDARLVPAAQATKNEDLHVHYLMDVNATPYLDGKTEIPTGDPNIVHSGEAAHTFEGLSPGAHSVTVVLTTADHKAIQQVPAATARFTVAGASAGSGNLPRSGDMPALTWPVFGLLGVTLVSGGLALLRRARSSQG
ncbi:MAG: hypothetical protein HY329_11190 [Chloroflexi bacterium]|nr:hypothetical protein [Chloroflexota bacterium]